MNYWLYSYGWGSPELWQFNPNTLTWSNIGGTTLTTSFTSVTLTVPYASLGLTAGQSIQFDAYTFVYNSGAVDDLANPKETINWYSQSYTNNLVESYTLTGASSAPPAPIIQSSVVGNQLGLTAGTVLGKGYILQSTSTLAPAVWTPVSFNSGTGGMITNTITINAAATPAFYRYLVQ